MSSFLLVRIKSFLPLILVAALAAGCSSTAYLVGLEDEVAFLDERLVPISSVDGPLYSWGAGERDFTRADTAPEPEGGMERLVSSVQYPPGARERCVQGDVMVRFVVDKEGKVVAAEPVESVDPDLDVAATYTVATAKFEPAIKDGEPVNVVTRIPISFNLQEARCARRSSTADDGDWRYR